MHLPPLTPGVLISLPLFFSFPSAGVSSHTSPVLLRVCPCSGGRAPATVICSGVKLKTILTVAILRKSSVFIASSALRSQQREGKTMCCHVTWGYERPRCNEPFFNIPELATVLDGFMVYWLWMAPCVIQGFYSGPERTNRLSEIHLFSSSKPKVLLILKIYLVPQLPPKASWLEMASFTASLWNSPWRPRPQQ